MYAFFATAKSCLTQLIPILKFVFVSRNDFNSQVIPKHLTLIY